mgnify:CR=1 FL=1
MITQEEIYEKPGLVRRRQFEAVEETAVELDESTLMAVKREVKALVSREVQFVVSFAACLAVALVAVISGINFYSLGNAQLGTSLGLPAIIGICGAAIVAYAHQRA